MAISKTEKQLAITYEEKRIGQYGNRDLGDLCALIGEWWKLQGCTQPVKKLKKTEKGELVPDENNELLLLAKWIYDNYPQLAYTDIELAMTWSLNGTTQPTFNPFLALSANYISHTINLYLEKKKDLINSIMSRKVLEDNKTALKKSSEPTPEELMKIHQEHVVMAYSHLTKDELFYDIGDFIYTWLKKTGQVNPDDKMIKAAFKYGGEKAEKELAKDKEKSTADILSAAAFEGNNFKKLQIKYGREYIMTAYFKSKTLGEVLSHLKLDDFKKIKNMFVEIPTYDEARERKDAGKATPLDTFIINHETLDMDDDSQWRRDLISMLQWVVDTEPFKK